MAATVTLDAIRVDQEVDTYLRLADEHLQMGGYTEHGLRHAGLVSHIAHNILTRLGHSQRKAELAGIAGYLHDIGNVISRYDHGQTGALMAWQILRDKGMEARELAVVVAAIGNHEEEYGLAVNDVAAALILADKSDVHRSRVRSAEPAIFDIHDRVNYAATRSFLRVDEDARSITLELTIDTTISPVMDYFEIF